MLLWLLSLSILRASARFKLPVFTVTLPINAFFRLIYIPKLVVFNVVLTEPIANPFLKLLTLVSAYLG
jgi:cytochrome c oxidase assembly factor CtaG